MHLTPTVCTFTQRADADAFLRELRHDPHCLPAGPVTSDDGRFSVRFFGAADLRHALDRSRRTLIAS